MDAGALPRSQIRNNGGTEVRANLRENMQHMVASSSGRQRLSDITNTLSSGRADLDERNSKMMGLVSSKDCIVQLMKENSSLLKLLAEKNKIMELTGIELQKLKLDLQKSNQQNWQLAQANSLMLAELNLKKDRLKVLQHELTCMSSILKLKSSELEEKEKLMRELQDKIEPEESGGGVKSEEAEEVTVQVANELKISNSSKKRKLKCQSLGSTIMEDKIVLDREVDGRRRSMRTKSSDLKSKSCEVKEELPKIGNAHGHQMVLEGKAEGRRKSFQSNLNSESCKLMELLKIDDGKIPVTHEMPSESKDDGRRKSLRRRTSNTESEACESTDNSIQIEDRFLVFAIKNKDLHQETTIKRDSSACNSSISVEQLKNGKQDSGESSDMGNRESRRSVGRPMRKAAERVNSYKEININVKLRRPE